MELTPSTTENVA